MANVLNQSTTKRAHSARCLYRTKSTSAVLNDIHEFNLPPVAPGRYTLRLRLRDVEGEIPLLELGGTLGTRIGGNVSSNTAGD